MKQKQEDITYIFISFVKKILDSFEINFIRIIFRLIVNYETCLNHIFNPIKTGLFWLV